MLVIKDGVDLEGVHPTLLFTATIFDQLVEKEIPGSLTVVTSGRELTRKHTTKIHYHGRAVDIGVLWDSRYPPRAQNYMAQKLRDHIGNQPVEIIVHKGSHYHLEMEIDRCRGVVTID